MKIKHPINFHKGLTALVVLAMMVVYHNFSAGSWIYLALHGGYGFLWLLKDQIFPDKRWETEIPFGLGVSTFFILGLYWIVPWLLISQGLVPSSPIMALAVLMNIVGVFLHFTSDAQKYFTLQYHSGLITEGFFARSRNPNYFGELLIYGGFALLSMHWLSAVIVGGFALAVFVPGMRQKDQSLSRYPEFERYRQQSGLLLPKFWGEIKNTAHQPR